jgi:hypothetical protein
MRLLRENKIPYKYRTLVLENLKQAKQYMDSGKLSKEDFEAISKADPTPQKKFAGWMAKIWIKDKPDMNDLRNKVEEFNTLLNRGKTKTKDINSFKNFDDLKNEVDQINKSGENISVKDLENDYETIIDNEDILIMCPHTHEASRKLGLSKFAFRDCEDGGKDSSWCTTYKAPDHFNDYYHKHGVTFYYIRVKSLDMKVRLEQAFLKKYKPYEVVALAVMPNGKIDGYDGLDNQMNKKTIDKFTSIIGIS